MNGRYGGNIGYHSSNQCHVSHMTAVQFVSGEPKRNKNDGGVSKIMTSPVNTRLYKQNRNLNGYVLVCFLVAPSVGVTVRYVGRSCAGLRWMEEAPPGNTRYCLFS